MSLAGCSGQGARLGLLEPASDRAPAMGNLWTGFWIAAFVIGILVWGLIIFVAVRYRRRKTDPDAPRQTGYHLPLELMYTLVPLLIIGVLFFFTVKAQNRVLDKAEQPAHTVNVVGQKWSWTFNYLEQANPAVNAVVYNVGTVDYTPDLYLPVDQPVRFNLKSADVIHSFWIPAFYFKMDVIPGKPNSFDVTPNKLGVFDGKCAEFCGTDHARMLFKVHVVSQQEFDEHLVALKNKGQVGERKAPEFESSIQNSLADEHAAGQKEGK